MMTIRGAILGTAKSLTEGDRNETYGEPFANMIAFAELLEGYFRAKAWTPDSDVRGFVKAEDAAHIMVLAKLARTINPKLPLHRDNYVDAAAYMAMACECADVERE